MRQPQSDVIALPCEACSKVIKNIVPYSAPNVFSAQTGTSDHFSEFRRFVIR